MAFSCRFLKGFLENERQDIRMLYFTRFFIQQRANEEGSENQEKKSVVGKFTENQKFKGSVT